MSSKPTTQHGTGIEGGQPAVASESQPSSGKASARLSYGIEWKSRARIFGIPLVHVAFGLNDRGRPLVAKGIVAIGQFAVGLVTIAQFGVGILFGLGQLIVGLTSVAQFACGVFLGIGQMASGIWAVGQIVAGIYGCGQTGWAKYMWSCDRVDMEAVAMFSTLLSKIY